MPIETVPVVHGVKTCHLAVARYFRDDRGGGDGGTAPVALWNRLMRKVQTRHAETVHDGVVAGWRQRFYGTADRVERRPMNVEAVDIGDRGHGYRPGGSRDN